MIGQGELAKGAGSESNSWEQILSPNYIDNYVHFGMVMQFVKYSTFYLIKCNYKHCFFAYINTLDSVYLHLWTLLINTFGGCTHSKPKTFTKQLSRNLHDKIYLKLLSI